MATSKSPIERYAAFLVAQADHCRGWTGKIDKYGNAQFSWTDEAGSHTGNAARWSWEYHCGPLPPDHRLHNTCGLLSCQRLSHWELQRWITGTTEQKYEAKVDRTSGPGDCQDWTGARDKDGYGIFSYREGGKVFTKRAHRYGYRLLCGPLSDDLGVLHTCDRPPCQQPAHWFLGDNAVNMADKTAKGRNNMREGEHHPQSVLTDAQVVEARSRYTGAHGEVSALAREYGITPRSMNKILHGVSRTKSTPPSGPSTV